MSATLGNAYKNQIMIGKFPMAVLNIEIDPKFTDINVHPSKLEVKFSKEDEVMGAIYHTVQNALYAIPNVPKIEHKTAVKSEFLKDTVTTKAQIEIAPKPVIVEKKAPVEDTKPKPVWETKSVTYEMPEKKQEEESYALLNSKEYFIKKQNEAANVEPKQANNLQMVAEDLSDNKTVEKIVDF